MDIRYQAARAAHPPPRAYHDWQHELIKAFRALAPEKDTISGRWQQGVVCRTVMRRPNQDSYLAMARYDINLNQGAVVESWRSVVEKLIRDYQPTFERSGSGALVKYASEGQIKARCGIRIRIRLLPVSEAYNV